jgi:hypothetical protein
MYPHIHFRAYIIEILEVKLKREESQGQNGPFVLVLYPYGATY